MMYQDPSYIGNMEVECKTPKEGAIPDVACAGEVVKYWCNVFSNDHVQGSIALNVSVHGVNRHTHVVVVS